MGNSLSTIGSLLPWHMLCYGTLLGMTLYQSIVMTKLCFITLPRREFMNLQKRVFPAYFRLQVGLAALTIATLPQRSFLSVMRRPIDTIPLVLVLITGFLNWLIYEPKTTKAMVGRADQEVRDGRSYRKTEGMSDAMKAANRSFSRNHAMSIHLNAISMIAAIAYTFLLASRMSVSEQRQI